MLITKLKKKKKLNDHKLGAKRVEATDEEIHAAERIGYQVRDTLRTGII